MQEQAEGPGGEMPDRIYEGGYRRLGGDRPRRWVPWPIARTAIVLAWRRRSTKLVLLGCGGVFFGHGLFLVGQILAERVVTTQTAGVISAEQLMGNAQQVFSSFLLIQFFFTAVALAAIAAGFVAEDRRLGALDLYFARSLRRRDYAAGKLLAAGLIPTATLIVPVIVLWIAGLGIAPAHLRAGLLGLGPPALLGALLATAVLSTTIIGISALGERGRSVGVIYVLGLLVLAGVGQGLGSAGMEWGGYLSPERDLRTIVEALLRITSRSVASQLIGSRAELNSSVLGSVLGLVGFVSVGLGALAWRMRRSVAG